MTIESLDLAPHAGTPEAATPPTLLIIDDISANIGALSGALESAGYRVLAALSGAAAIKSASKARPELILLDVMMPELDGIETCRRLKANPATAEIPVVFITANDETQSLVEGFRAGGVDYITKPFQIDEVLLRVATHLRLHRLTCELKARTIELAKSNAELTAEIRRRERAEVALDVADARLSVLTEAEARSWGLQGFLGQSPQFKKLLRDIRAVQVYPRTNVLLTGESGTGKELIARAIHFGGALAKGPFVAVNCSALPAELAESYLFGHRRGAFTGAVADHKGYFELADGGTLFLDEIGDMPPAIQAKLLRVLEDGQVTAVGASAGNRVSVRIVAATNVDLPAKVQRGEFRQDLYYRLMHFHVAVPPLRERREDIPALAGHFVRLFSSELKRKPPVLRADALERLLAHDYPGNIRELKNTIERAIIYAGGEQIHPEHIVFAAHARTASGSASAPESEPKAENPADDFNLKAAEDRLIEKAVAASKGNTSAAARLLGVDRAKIYRWQQSRRANP
ncbi:MAG TPA: sigma-54 dependent transcriptional regulator [Opitutaceae bacterium]|nr:sigma-54 dependent transcriptional regulator [Opitutaceae bacterium]